MTEEKHIDKLSSYSNIISDVLKEHLNSFFPNYSASIMLQSIGYTIENGSISNDYNEFFKDSIFDYNPENKQLIHYTNLEAVSSIIKNQEIYLSNVNNVNDPQEGYVLFKDFDTAFIKSDDFKSFRANTYTFSFCEYNNKEDFDAWKYYGNDGKGIALIFEINPLYYDHWRNFHLSEIKYTDSNEQIQNLIKALNNNIIKKFRTENIQINLPRFIYKIWFFYKNSNWINEKEIRLLHYNDNYNNPNLIEKIDNSTKIKKYITKKIGFGNFVPVKENNDEVLPKDKPTIISDPYQHLKREPEIVLKKIIVGYRFEQNEFNNIKTHLQTIMRKNGILTSTIEISLSIFRKYFI